MKKLLSAILFLLLAACATATTPAQRVFQAQSNYNAGLAIAVAYKALPECPAALLCKKSTVVKDLQDADDIAAPAVLSAQACVRTPTCTTADIAANAATAAVALLTKITATLAVKEQK